MEGFMDVHSHILPGLDDGAGDMEQTKAMLQIAYAEGIRGIIATPHFYASARSAPAERIRAVLAEVQEALREWGMDITLYPGNEIYYRREVPELLEQGKILTLADSRFVLVEFDPGVEYPYLRDGIVTLTSYGYVPVLAHAERYDCLFEKKERPERIRAHGALLQVNASSFDRGLWDPLSRRVRSLLREDLVDLVGTDAHGSEHRRPLMRETAAHLYKKAGRERAEEILTGNPRKILEDGEF